MELRDKQYVIKTLEEYLDSGDFFGKIELNCQNSKIISVNVTRCLKPKRS